MKISIFKPELRHLPSVIDLMTETVTDTFRKNGIDDEGDLKREIAEQIERVKTCLDTVSGSRYFLAAETENRLAGIAGFFPLSQIILRNISGVPKSRLEIGSVYIRPRFQRRGIALLLLEGLLEELVARGAGTVYLDSGYSTSQVYWRLLFGDPVNVLPDYFGKASPYMIWEIDTTEALEKVRSRKK